MANKIPAVRAVDAPTDTELAQVMSLAAIARNDRKSRQDWLDAEEALRRAAKRLNRQARKTLKKAGRKAGKKTGRRADCAIAEAVAATSPDQLDALGTWIRKERAIVAFEQRCSQLGLPDPVTPDNPYTRYGIWWHRRRLARRLVEAGLTAERLDDLAGFFPGTTWAARATWAAQMRDLVAFAGRVGGDNPPSALAAVRSFEAHRHYRHIEAVGRLIAASPAAEGVPVRDAVVLALAGVTDVAGRVRSVAELIVNFEITGAQAKQLAELVGDDPIKARLVSRRTPGTAPSFDELVVRAREIAKMRPYDALMRWGTVSDVIESHLGLDGTDAACVAATLGCSPAGAAADSAEAIAVLRRLSRPAVSQIIAAVVAEGDPTGQKARAAVCVAACFGRGWSAWVTQARRAAEAAGKPWPGIARVAQVLPLGPDSREFGEWLNQGRRTQALFNSATGMADVTRIGANWRQLDPRERKGPAAEVAAVVRAKAYGPLGATAMGRLGAELEIEPVRLRAIAQRWERTLGLPTPFDLVARFVDESSGLTGRFLPRTDPRGLWLGELTDCCQHPLNAGASCAWAGCENPMMGFFVVEDPYGAVQAQSWVWADAKGRVCFDSIERKAGQDHAGGQADGPRVERISEADLDWYPQGAKSAKESNRQVHNVDARLKKAWAIRRLYRQAAYALCAIADTVTVGPMRSVPDTNLARAEGELVGDPASVGYCDYRDSQHQRILARRESRGATLTPVANGFCVTAGSKTVTVTATNAGDGQVVLSGPAAARMALEVLARMGPRTWAVTDRRGRKAKDPSGGGWTVAGPRALALDDTAK